MVGFEREEIDCFRSLIAERLGLYFEDAKFDHLADILRARMRATGCARFAAYLQHLNSAAAGRAESRLLAEQLTVGETYFFRHPDHFRVFAEVALPQRVQARGAQRLLRILSAGCASGEEPYSLAALVRENLADLASWNVTILGLDINTSFLEKASRARYSTWSLRDTPEHLRERHFRPEGKEFVLAESLRSMVSFEERNLMQEDPGLWQAGIFDIIFCRNVTMYFSPDAMRAVVARMTRALADGGFLFLGPAETLRGISQEFHLRHTHDTFYYQRRHSGETRTMTFAPPRVASVPLETAPSPVILEPDDSWVGVICRASERIATLARNSTPHIPCASENTAFQSVPLVACPPVRPATGGQATSGTQKPEISPARGIAVPLHSTGLKHAREFLGQERFEEALEVLQALPPESAADPDAQLLRAVVLTNQGNVADAERVCQQVLAIDELNAGAHYLKALSREHADDRLAAMEQDQIAVYLDPMFAMPHLHLGLLAKRAGDIGNARRELNHAATLLAREEPSRILLFGGGFNREALIKLCRAELRACGGST